MHVVGLSVTLLDASAVEVMTQHIHTCGICTVGACQSTAPARRLRADLQTNNMTKCIECLTTLR